MTGDTPLRFGTVEVASACVSADARVLHLELLDGELKKHQLGMLIYFLMARLEQLNELEPVTAE